MVLINGDKMSDLINKVAELNNLGIAFEKRGELDGAIGCYEKNIKLRYPATHSYERLMTLYRRLKKPDEEVRVIKIAIEVFESEVERRRNLGIFTANIEKTVNGYMQRLEKTLERKSST